MPRVRTPKPREYKTHKAALKRMAYLSFIYPDKTFKLSINREFRWVVCLVNGNKLAYCA